MSELIPEPPDRGFALSGRFFQEARQALLDPSYQFDFSIENMLVIVRDAGLRSDFERRFRTEVNDPELKRLILRFLEEMAISLEESAARDIDGVDTLDKAGLPVAIPVTVAGAGVVITMAGNVGSIIFLAAGLISVAVLGVARIVTRRKATRDTYSARRFRELIRHLEGGGGNVV